MINSWFLHCVSRYGHISEVWDLLKNVLPEFKLPLQEWEKALLEEEKAKKEETASAVSHQSLIHFGTLTILNTKRNCTLWSACLVVFPITYKTNRNKQLDYLFLFLFCCLFSSEQAINSDFCVATFKDFVEVHNIRNVYSSFWC